MDIDIPCRRCQTVSDAMLRWQVNTPASLKIEIGTLDEFNSALSCKTCQAILDYFRSQEDFADLEELDHPASSCRLWFGRMHHKQRFKISLIFGEEDDEDDVLVSLELTPPKALEPNTGYYVKTDPQWIDISKIARWPVCCDMDHEGVCHTLPAWKTLDFPAPLIVIDVESWSLTSVKLVPYVALSYVWGKIPDVLLTLKSNYASLQKPGALASKDLSSRLPRTVFDAIILTKAMGQRYLWVDALCIVQDDHENKKAQLDNMAAIYARSYFTIVAADGSDANHGLQGVPGATFPRNYLENMYHFSEKCTMMHAPVSLENLPTKEWHTRGWTFQERTASIRNLIFFHSRVFWECQHSIWTESIADIAEGATPLTISRRKPGNQYDLQFEKYPDLHQYANLVQRYNSRLLSFDSDALFAFSAVLQVLSRSFPGGFLYGLPEYFFDYALLWAPVFPQKARKHAFPSWSWLSHEGEMAFMFYNKCDKAVFKMGVGKFVILPPAVEISPMVTWYKSSSSGKRVRIDNSYGEHQEFRHGTKRPLPPGWEARIHHQTHPKLNPNQIDVTYFRNPEAPGTAFIYPLPLASQPLKPSTAAEPWSSQLSFSTTRRHLIGGPAVRGHAESGGVGFSGYWNAEVAGCLAFSLLDEMGMWVGVMRSNTGKESEIPVGEGCEIVVLSKGVVQSNDWEATRLQFSELVVREELRGVEVYEFLNVMWIERRSGVAFRKGVGRVWKRAWERGGAEEVDIVLG